MNKKSTFDTFLLSCRVLGRGVEDAFLIQSLKLATIRNCKVAIGEYYATRKNSQVSDFYAKQGFEILKEKTKLEGQKFQYELDGQIKLEPAFFMKIDSEIDHQGEAQL